MTHHESCDLARRNLEAEVVENSNIRSGGVTEVDSLDVQYSPDLLWLLSFVVECVYL